MPWMWSEHELHQKSTIRINLAMPNTQRKEGLNTKRLILWKFKNSSTKGKNNILTLNLFSLLSFMSFASLAHERQKPTELSPWQQSWVRGEGSQLGNHLQQQCFLFLSYRRFTYGNLVTTFTSSKRSSLGIFPNDTVGANREHQSWIDRSTIVYFINETS